MKKGNLPYFDFLLSQLSQQNATIETSFGRHVHWGYWPNPDAAVLDNQDYAQAAEQLTRELYGLANIRDGERLLDVGCGFGGTIASLNENHAELDMTGLNIDGRQLERAKAMVLPLQANRINFCQGDATVLPFADASYDNILAVECIFHFPSRERFFAEAFRVLKPGGSLVLSDFVPSQLFLPLALLSKTKQFSKINFFGHCDVGYTVGRYRSLAADTGFKVSAMRDITRHTLPTYRYLPTMLGEAVRKEGLERQSRYMIEMLWWLGRLGLLNYYLIALTKP